MSPRKPLRQMTQAPARFASLPVCLVPLHRPAGGKWNNLWAGRRTARPFLLLIGLFAAHPSDRHANPLGLDGPVFAQSACADDASPPGPPSNPAPAATAAPSATAAPAAWLALQVQTTAPQTVAPSQPNGKIGNRPVFAADDSAASRLGATEKLARAADRAALGALMPGRNRVGDCSARSRQRAAAVRQKTRSSGQYRIECEAVRRRRR